MGCDIHLHVELKIGDQWHHYNHPRVPRDYNLFGLMAGVRGEGPPVVTRRGLPEDISAVTRLEYAYERDDAHSASWLSSKEVAEVVRLYKKRWLCDARKRIYWESKYFGYLFGNDYSGYWENPEDRGPEIDDFRFVFWFDN